MKFLIYPPKSRLIILITLSLIICLMKLRTYNEPIERDIAIYAVAASEIRNGKILYKDIWDNKTPALYFTYLFAELLFGQGEMQIYFLYLIPAIAILAAVYFVSRELTKSHGFALFAAVCWTIVSGDLLTEANQPNTEIFMNCFLIWAMFFYLRALRNSQKINLLLCGFFLAIACLYKQYCILFAVFLLFEMFIAERCNIKKLFHAFIMIFSPTIIFFLLVIVFFYFQNAHEDFIHMIFIHPFSYFSMGEEKISIFEKASFALRHFYRLFIFPVRTFLPMIFANFAGLVFGLLRNERKWKILLAAVLSAFAMIAAPWKFYPHYYQLLTPLLCIGSALAISEFSGMKTANERLRKIISQLVPVSIVTLLMLIQLPDYFMNADWWSYKKYGPVFIYCRQIGEEIREKISPDEKFFQWGYEASLYFYAQRRPATGRFFNAPFIFSPKKDEYTKMTIEEFEKSPPALIVLPREYSREHPLIKWILGRYEAADDFTERRKIEDGMIAKTLEMSEIEKPVFIQKPLTPPMYFYKPKTREISGNTNEER